MSRSSIARDADVRAAVDQALARGSTIDQIVEHLRALGSDVSRSAIGRYAQDYRQIAAQQRDMTAVASAFAGDFGQAGDKQTRLLIQLATSMLTREAIRAASAEPAEGEGTSTKELADFARAVKDITSAAKTDADRDARVREETRKQAKIEAAEAAAGAARAGGASDDTIDQIKRKILGIAA